MIKHTLQRNESDSEQAIDDENALLVSSEM
jgi:hypothetical protein